MKMLVVLVLASVWTPWASWTKLLAVSVPSLLALSACMAYGEVVMRFIGNISPSAEHGAVPNVVQLVDEPATFMDSQIVSWFQSTLEPNGLLEPRLTDRKPFLTRTPLLPPLLI